MMADWDRSSTSDNASVISPDSTRVVALETTNEETSKLEFSEDEEMLIAKMFSLVRESREEIVVQPRDEAQSIELKEKSGPSTGQTRKYFFGPEKRPISICPPSETGPQQKLGPTTIEPNNISVDQKLVNPAHDKINQ
ncbi:hypothetical protein MTR67_032430 [Solanum verrucosum]|uniref:Uncharacterized protein n=1 Tax=Solanum verrucosum TaxID=315347 RepID=A0AAF0U4G5_SOLVR|nr:hypothetical protein MTR67_032430 [Solanum verrucosum]